MTASATWRRRWEKAVRDLDAARAESKILRTALDDLNQEVEGLLNAQGQGGIESAKSWLIKAQRDALRKQKALTLPPVDFIGSSSDDRGYEFTGGLT
jgi:hypothetical protein